MGWTWVQKDVNAGRHNGLWPSSRGFSAAVSAFQRPPPAGTDLHIQYTHMPPNLTPKNTLRKP